MKGGKSMTSKTEKIIKSAVKISLKCGANSTTSIFCYQPKAPAALKKFSKINDK